MKGMGASPSDASRWDFRGGLLFLGREGGDTCGKKCAWHTWGDILGIYHASPGLLMPGLLQEREILHF